MNYFAFRVSSKHAQELSEELKIGHLRQGWGYGKNQNLRLDESQHDPKAKRNLPILHNVKKGDYLIVISMPDYKHVTLARATKDFLSGYIYDEMSLTCGDFGHIFPAEHVKVLLKSQLSNDLRNSFHCGLRFFSLQKHADEIQKFIS